jgi:phosphoribosyl 1,2-cyclic phosphodiesterase
VKVTLWGTRGSHAGPGADTVKYGGHTSCVEVRGKDGAVLVLDAGTGAGPLGKLLAPDTGRVDLLLTHLHMDHIQGLGFFAPLFIPGREVHIWGPPSTTETLWTRLARYLSPPLFPVRLRDFPCDLTVHDVGERHSFSVGGLQVESALIIHPDGAVGYRVTESGRSMAFLPDHEPALGAKTFPLGPEWTSGYELCTDVDLLVHDAQYTDEEYAMKAGWGHSTFEHVLAFAELVRARHLVTFHHDPSHTDTMLDEKAEEIRRRMLPFAFTPGIEGATFRLSE